MVFNCPLNIGDLVEDSDPYKSPELYKGHGVITMILNDNYVMVLWFWSEVTEAVDIGYLEFVN